MTMPRDRQATASGSGWERLAQAVSEVLPPAEVDGVWIFAPVRREEREWGTAVLSRVDGDRRRIYTAGYVLVVKGKQRGKFESTIQELGSGPMDALARVLQEAQRRIDDEHPPSSVAPEAWFSSVVAPADGTS
ncbi:MAG TPA: hypothetical protein VGQ24_12405 [Gemmatimonadales bacterium]|jgi:hypothetical protein|nr:hypothetical protein [Gemmatimonadales bacterium]